jgi:hypothetical protein
MFQVDIIGRLTSWTFLQTPNLNNVDKTLSITENVLLYPDKN